VPGAADLSEDDLYTVVGVVETIKHNDLTAPIGEHKGAYYFTYRQAPQSFLTLVVRSGPGTTDLTPALRDALGAIDPELPLYGIQTLASRVDDSLASRRVPLMLLGVFAAVALFLAVLGIYGALGYTVTQRNREIGIRMALGGAPRDIFRRVVLQGMTVTGVGLILGTVAALALTRLIRSLLFGVQATDPRVMLAVAFTLAVVGLLACLIPARRATAVDAVRVLTG
jgi:ABC-type antimicrobial peptide transport system permease subunit